MNQSNTKIFILKLATNEENLTMSQFSLNQQFEELVKASLMEEQVLGHNKNNSSNNNNSSNTDNKMMAKNESAKSPDFFQDNNAIKRMKTAKRHTNTGVKSTNFSSNIS